MSSENTDPVLSEAQRLEELRLIACGSCGVRIGQIVMNIRRHMVLKDPRSSSKFMAVAMLREPEKSRPGMDEETGIEISFNSEFAYIPLSVLSKAKPLVPEGQEILDGIRNYVGSEQQKLAAPEEDGPPTLDC